MNINLNQIALAIALTVASTLPVIAFPVSSLKFATGSHCVYSGDVTRWHSVNVLAGQTITVILHDEHDSGSNSVIRPNGKETYLDKARIDAPVYGAVVYEFGVRESGNYQFRSYPDEGYDTAYPIAVCAK